jgi:hypothetical protein
MASVGANGANSNRLGQKKSYSAAVTCSGGAARVLGDGLGRFLTSTDEVAEAQFAHDARNRQVNNFVGSAIRRQSERWLAHCAHANRFSRIGK